MSLQEIESDADRDEERRRRLKAKRNRRYYRSKKMRERLKKRLTKSGLLFADYDGLIAAIKHRRRALGLSQLALDDVTELPDGYTGKLEAKIKSLGPKSLPKVLDALGLDMALIPRRRT